MFEWDEQKDALHLAKHGISFDEAAAIFEGQVISRRDSRRDYGEERYISIGSIQGIVVVVVVHTRRKHATRIISARLANKSERRLYNGNFQGTS